MSIFGNRGVIGGPAFLFSNAAREYAIAVIQFRRSAKACAPLVSSEGPIASNEARHGCGSLLRAEHGRLSLTSTGVGHQAIHY